MKSEEFYTLWEKHNDEEFLEFSRVKNKRSKRADVHAILMLDEITPGDDDMVSCADHDQIWLCPDMDRMRKTITEDQIIELLRCGVMLDSDNDSLSMFV